MKEEERPEKFLGKFIFTNLTATFGQKTLQLCNVSKIEVGRFKEVTKAVYSISDQVRSQALKAIGVGALLLLLGGFWEALRIIGILVIIAGGAIVWYYYDERSKKKDYTYNYYGLFFDCTSGKTEVLWFDNYEDVVKLFDRITNSMNRQEVASFVANITDNRMTFTDSKNIVVNSEIRAGEMIVGDRTA